MKKIAFSMESIRKQLKRYAPPIYVVKQTVGEDGVDGRIVSYVDKMSHIAEQYKVLRTNLISLSPVKPVSTIVITSSHAWEGKTVTSCNLAVTLSLDKEKKTLLVDADLRKPGVHSMFGLSREPGFSDVLSDFIGVEKFLAKPAIENLYVIPAGSLVDDPSELLSLGKVETLLNRLKSEFDYIILDTPPVLEFTDASILGSFCDAVILAIKAGSTQKEAIEEAFNLLEEAKAKPKACILTNVQVALDAHYYFYKYKSAAPAGKR